MKKDLEQNKDLEHKDTQNKSFSIGFYGGVGEVTGANFLLQIGESRMLIDCGLIQGFKRKTDPNYQKFVYDASSIQYLFITHAHIDHIGRIGKLVKEGFRGKIYSTQATYDLSRLMLEDALKLTLAYAQRKNLTPLYSEKDLQKAQGMWEVMEYRDTLDVQDVFSVTAYNTGHILGSCAFVFENKKTHERITFTGDLGNSPNPLLPPADTDFETEYMIIESVYGDRNHEEIENRKNKLQEVITDVSKRGGTILMPVFSLEKTQMLLTELNDLVEQKKIPEMPIFLDSPLAIRLTEVYRENSHNFNERIQKQIKSGDDVFDFPRLKFTYHHAQSAEINKVRGPKIIISASGISEGGRITAHEKNHLPRKEDALVLIGHQILGSLGRKILEGEKSVFIDGDTVAVNAEILSVDGYSSHADSNQLLKYTESVGEKLKKVFVCMGEYKSSFFLSQRIQDYSGIEAIVPEENAIEEL